MKIRNFILAIFVSLVLFVFVVSSFHFPFMRPSEGWNLGGPAITHVTQAKVWRGQVSTCAVVCDQLAFIRIVDPIDDKENSFSTTGFVSIGGALSGANLLRDGFFEVGEEVFFVPILTNGLPSNQKPDSSTMGFIIHKPSDETMIVNPRRQ